jgi:hypothetical protein
MWIRIEILEKRQLGSKIGIIAIYGNKKREKRLVCLAMSDMVHWTGGSNGNAVGHIILAHVDEGPH